MFQIIMLKPDHRATFLLSKGPPGGANRSIQPGVEITFMPNQEVFMRWGQRSKSGALELDVHRIENHTVQDFYRNGLAFQVAQNQVDAVHDILDEVVGRNAQLDIRPPSPEDMRSLSEDMGRKGRSNYGRSGSEPPLVNMNFQILRLRQDQLERIQSSNPPCMWPTSDQLELIKEKTVTFHVTPGFGFGLLNPTIKKFSLEVTPSEMGMHGAGALKANICEKVKDQFTVDVNPSQIAVGRQNQYEEIDSLDGSIFNGDPRRGIGAQNVFIYQLVNPMQFQIVFLPQQYGEVKFGLGQPFEANLHLSMTTKQLKEMIASSDVAHCTLRIADMSIGYADYTDINDAREIWRYGLSQGRQIKVRGGDYGGMTVPIMNVILVRVLGSGSFGDVYLGYSKNGGYYQAIKILRRYDKDDADEEVRLQQLFYRRGEGTGFISAIGYAVRNFPYQGGQSYVISMDLLGKSLEDLLKHMGKFSKDMVCILAAQMIARLKTVHDAGFVYRDVKPDNFMMGLESKKSTVYLSDFGLVHDMGHANTHGLVGTARYCSIDAHLGKELYRYSDLEAVGYVLAYFLKGELPWKGLGREYDRIYNKKEKTTPAMLFKGEADIFVKYMEAVRQKGDGMPDYAGSNNSMTRRLVVFSSHHSYKWRNVQMYPKASLCIQDE